MTKMLALALATSALCAFGAKAEELTVYTALEAEFLERYAAAFNADHPEIRINWVRDSTGVITAKLLAEKNNPQADVVWGLAATSLLVLKAEGMLEPYAAKGLQTVDARYRDADNPPSWVGMDAWAATICFNTVEGAKLGLTAPTSWADLTRPEYTGHIVMPNPASSGTGFLDVSSWLQMMGNDAGWAYMDALHNNIAAYTHSGSKPCKMAAAGEVPIGISFEFRAAKSKADGAPIDIIIPTEGIGWDLEASAIVAGTDAPEAAQTLIDWSITPAAMAQYNEGYAVLAVPGLAKPVKYLPDTLEASLIKNDFEWAANNREAILKEWSARYDGKSEARN
ncbi:MULTISPECIES: putative 2-aminoethylphosphonate ABC transporter substrate-binding protein [unclassified Haematobacter]|uniref:putative 2-aminoethylphosphonate ABC transporter substrate-binding protein n=1 Tax=unclassified Haematobacter TaxID=2640585 RepID=UPI0025C6D5D3|nr:MULTISPECIES: putative 2-aminoethylphosphonate ABC transporter substrate-binding protein [unclassified Haematobacter]